MMMLIRRLLRPVADLDRDTLPPGNIERVDGTILEVDDPPKRAQIRKFTNLLLRQFQIDKAVAANLFYDREDECLRMLMYLKNSHTEQVDYLELVPSVRCFAEPMLDYLAKCAGMRRRDVCGEMRFIYEGKHQVAHCESYGPDEIRLYFGDERPEMRTKIVHRAE